MSTPIVPNKAFYSLETEFHGFYQIEIAILDGIHHP